jgi:acyl-coenzyme A synthetase/AMP-(fatty) acid ligase
MGDTITYAGVVVDLDDAEASLRERDDVADVVAVGVSDNYVGKALQLYVVLAPDATPDNDRRKSLIADVAGRLDGNKPRALRFVTAIPRRADGSPAREVVAAVVMGDDVDATSVTDPATIEAIRAAR